MLNRYLACKANYYEPNLLHCVVVGLYWLIKVCRSIKTWCEVLRDRGKDLNEKVSSQEFTSVSKHESAWSVSFGFQRNATAWIICHLYNVLFFYSISHLNNNRLFKTYVIDLLSSTSRLLWNADFLERTSYRYILMSDFPSFQESKNVLYHCFPSAGLPQSISLIKQRCCFKESKNWSTKSLFL